MKFIAIFTIVFILIVGCRKAVDTPDIVPDVKIRYVDSMGNDIFSPSHDGQNGYWMDSVRIYDYKNGIKMLIYQAPTLYLSGQINDTTFGYMFTTYSNIGNIPGEYMVISPDEDVVNRYSNSIIQLKAGVYDTLKVHLSGDAVFGSQYDSVWYNSQYEPTGRGRGLMTIVK